MRANGARLLACALGLALVVGAGAVRAGAQTITVHDAKLSLKGLAQDQKNNGDDTIDKGTVNEKDVALVCLGRPLEKDEKVVIVIDCADLDAEIHVIDTDPVGTVQVLGNVIFDQSFQVITEKKGEISSVRLQGQVDIDCGANVLTADLDASFEVKFKDLGGMECPDSVKGSGFGDGSLLGIGVLVDSGSKIDGGKRQIGRASW